MTKVLVFSASSHGHRGEYNIVLEREFRAQGVDVEFTNRILRLVTTRRIFFAMIEEAMGPFVLLSVLSLFTGQRVVGLLFRIGECFKSGPKHRLKRHLLRFLIGLPRVRILTILPFDLSPRFAEVASGWVYDPQLWDFDVFEDLRISEATPLSDEVRRRAGGRRTVVALGEQNRGKGFDRLSDIWSSSEDFRRRVLVVAAGRVAATSRSAATTLQASGAFVIDRFVSPAELRSLYGVSDLVWGAYHPTYDQASGITGRAFQFGIPVILRRGSLIAKLMTLLNGSRVEIDYDDEQQAVRMILEAVSGRQSLPSNVMKDMRAHFSNVILETLGILRPLLTR